MKNQTRGAILILLFALDSFTIAQWSQIATINSPQLNAVKFFDEYTGITVGQGGIWRSTNSGLNWAQVLSGVDLNSVSFPNINTGYAVGDSGKIYKSTNNGLNWFQQSFNTSNIFYSVSFFNANTGFVVGQNGIILRTTSGGSLWYQNANPRSDDLNCVHMTENTQTAMAVGSSSLNHQLYCVTDNGGVFWTYSLNVPNNYLRYVYNIPNYNGYVMAVGTNGVIIKTTNYGVTFSLITSPTTMALNCIVFLDSEIGFIAGNGGKILRTTSSGNSWFEQVSGTGNDLMSVSFINSQTGWIVGVNGLVLRTGIPVGVFEFGCESQEKFELFQNYPNPFNPQTRIKFDVSSDESQIKINIYDISGKLITNLAHTKLNIGSYSITWDAENISSGIYFCQLSINKKNKYLRMVLTK